MWYKKLMQKVLKMVARHVLNRKLIAVVVVESLLFNTIVCADGNSVNTQNIEIPSGKGSVSSAYEGDTSNGIVIHIRDTHTSVSAQKNIAGILQYLRSEYAVDLVGTEGAIGKIHTDEFSRFPDRAIKQKVAGYFLKDGKIDGAEYASIVENTADEVFFSIIGIESDALYRENFAAFLRTVPDRRKIRSFCNDTLAALSQLKENIYSRRLLMFDTVVAGFHDDSVTFQQYCMHLKEHADAMLVLYDDYAHFKDAIALFEMEKSIDFNKLDIEYAHAKMLLINSLPEEQVTALHENEIRYKTQLISAHTYYAQFRQLLGRQQIPLDGYPHLQAYIDYIERYASFSLADALGECAAIENAIYAELFTDNRQRALHSYYTFVGLMELCVDLKISPAQLGDYRLLREQCAIHELLSFVNDESKRYSLLYSPGCSAACIEENINHFDAFYTLAQRREREMVDNLLALKKNQGRQNIVLLAGGFHTPGIESILRQKNISYVVVTPQVSGERESIPYLSLLTNNQTGLEKILANERSTLKIASWLTDSPLMYPERTAILSKKMKTLLTTTKLHDLYKNILAQYPPQQQEQAGRQIEQQLAETINTVIHVAGYRDVLQIDAIHLSPEGLRASVRYPDTGSTVHVTYDRANPSEKLPADVEDSLLEIVSFSDGVTGEFVIADSGEPAAESLLPVYGSILQAVLDGKKNARQVHESVSRNHYKITVLQTERHLQVLQQLGLVEKTDDAYTPANGEPAQFTSFFIRALAARSGDSELAWLDSSMLPDSYKPVFERLHIRKIYIEQSVGLDGVYGLVSWLVGLDADKQSVGGNTFTIDGNLQASVRKPIGSDTSIIYVTQQRRTPPAPGTALRQTQAQYRQEIDLEKAFGSIAPQTAENQVKLQVFSAVAEMENHYNQSEFHQLLLPSERAALFDYALQKYAPDADTKERLRTDLMRALGLPAQTQPRYTRKAGRLIIGNPFTNRLHSALRLLLSFNPELSIDDNLEQRLVAALVSLHVARQSGTPDSGAWRELVGSVVASASGEFKNSTAGKAVRTALDAIDRAQKEKGSALTVDEYQRIVAEEINAVQFGHTNRDMPYLANITKRRALLDTASAARSTLPFESTDGQVHVKLEIAQKNDDGTYIGIDGETGDMYTIEAVSFSRKNSRFTFKNIEQQSLQEFNDPAGFYIHRRPFADMPLSTGEAQLKAYSVLQQEWKSFLADESAVVIDANIDDITASGLDVSQQLSLIDKQVADNLAEFRLKMQQHKERAGTLESYRQEQKKLLTRQVAIITERNELQKTLDAKTEQLARFDDAQQSETQLVRPVAETMIAKVILMNIISHINLASHQELKKGAGPADAVDNALAQMFRSDARSEFTQHIDDPAVLQDGLDFASILTAKVRQDIHARLKNTVDSAQIDTVLERLLSDQGQRSGIPATVAANLPHLRNVMVSINKVRSANMPLAERNAKIAPLLARLRETVDTSANEKGFVAIRGKQQATAQERQSLEREIEQLRERIFVTSEQELASVRAETKTVQAQIAQIKQQSAQNRATAISLRAGILYNKQLSRAVETIKTALGNGSREITIGKQSVAITADALAYIINGLAYYAVLEPYFRREQTKDTSPEAMFAYEVYKKTTDTAYQEFYTAKDAFRTGAHDSEPVHLDANADTVVYGPDKKPSNPVIGNLITDAIGALKTHDPVLAAWMREQGSIAVTKKPFVSTAQGALLKLFTVSKRNNAVYVEKTVFSKIAHLAQSAPDRAAKLLAAQLAVAGFGIVDDTMLAVNQATKRQIASFIRGKVVEYYLESGDPAKLETDRMQKVIDNLVKRSATAIVQYRKNNAQITDVNELQSILPDGMFGLISQHIRVLPTGEKQQFDKARAVSQKILGADIDRFRSLLVMEYELYTGAVMSGQKPDDLHVADETYLHSSFTNPLLTPQQQYALFFKRIFGSDQVFNTVESMTGNLKPAASHAMHLAAMQELNRFLADMTDLKKYDIKLTQDEHGNNLYYVRFPNGAVEYMSLSEKKALETHITELNNSFSVYFDPLKGLGITFQYPGKKAKQLPLLVAKVDTQKELERELSYARSAAKLVGHNAMTTAINHALTGFPGVPAVAVREDVQTIRTQQATAIQLRQYFDALMEQLTTRGIRISYGERKGLAAMFLIDSQLGLEWTAYISGIYDETVPLIYSSRIAELHAAEKGASIRSNFYTAKLHLQRLAEQPGWDAVEASQRRAIAGAIAGLYGLDAGKNIDLPGRRTIDELTAFSKVLHKLDERAAIVPDVSLNPSSLVFMVRHGLTYLENEPVAAAAGAVFNYYRMLIDAQLDRLPDDIADGDGVRKELNKLRQLLIQAIITNARNAVDKFNQQNAGVVRVNVLPDTIDRNPEFILGLLRELSTGDVTEKVSFFPDGIRPAADASEVVIEVTAQPGNYELTDPIALQRYESGEPVFWKHALYVHPATCDLSDDRQQTILRNEVDDAVNERTAQIARFMSIARENSLPLDLRLMLLSNDTLKVLKTEFELESGFQSVSLEYSDIMTGSTYPVGMHPARFQEIVDYDTETFRTALTLVETATHHAGIGDMHNAKLLLVQAQQLVAGLRYISPKLRGSLVQTIESDIRRLDAEADIISAINRDGNILIYGSRHDIAQVHPQISRHALVPRLIDLALSVVEQTDPQRAQLIRSSASIVIGHRPREGIPVNTIFIEPVLFDNFLRLAQYASDKNIFTENSMPSLGLARLLADAANLDELKSAVVFNEFSSGREDIRSFVIPYQLAVEAPSADFTGDVIAPFTINYDTAGRPLIQKDGPHLRTTFRNGIPVSVSHSETGERFALESNPFMPSPAGHIVSYDAEGAPESIETFSAIERWVGHLDVEDSLYFLSYQGQVLALVKAEKDIDRIYPLIGENELNAVTGASGMSQALDILRHMAALRRQQDVAVRTESDQQELLRKLFPDSVRSDVRKPRSNEMLRKGMHIASSLCVPLILLGMIGCASVSHQPIQIDPYANQALFPAAADTVDQPVADQPDDLQEFIGSSGDVAVDLQATESISTASVELLQRQREQLAVQLPSMSTRQERQNIQHRIDMLDVSIAYLNGRREAIEETLKHVPEHQLELVPVVAERTQRAQPVNHGAVNPVLPPDFTAQNTYSLDVSGFPVITVSAPVAEHQPAGESLSFQTGAIQITPLGSRDFYVETSQTPYIGFRFESVEQLENRNLTLFLELTNVQTGRKANISHDVSAATIRDGMVYIPLKNLEPGQWKYDINVLDKRQPVISQSASFSGHIQKGKAVVDVGDVMISGAYRFDDDQGHVVVPFEYGEQFDVGSYTVTVELKGDGVMLVTARDEQGAETEHMIHVNSRKKMVLLGDRIVFFGFDSADEPVAVHSQYRMADFVFTVTQQPQSQSPVTFVPEVSFLHPLVGEVAIPADTSLALGLGEEKMFTVAFPVITGMFARDHGAVSGMLEQLDELRYSFDDKMAALAVTPSGDAQRGALSRSVREELQNLLSRIDAILERTVDYRLFSQVLMKEHVDLAQTRRSLADIIDLTKTADDTHIPELILMSSEIVQQVRTDLDNVSTQQFGYRLSLHDPSGVLGEQLYSLGVSVDVKGPSVISEQNMALSPDGTIKNERQIAVSDNAYQPSDMPAIDRISEEHQTYMAAVRQSFNAQERLQDMMRDYTTMKYVDIPRSQFSIDRALFDVQQTTDDLERAQTMGLIGMFNDNIAMLKNADFGSDGRPHMLGYMERVIDGEKVVYDTSTKLIIELLDELQQDDALKGYNIYHQLLRDIGRLLFIVKKPGVSADEAKLFVDGFLKGSDPEQIERAHRIVDEVMVMDGLNYRERAALIVSQLVTDPDIRAYLRHAAYDMLEKKLAAEETAIEENEKQDPPEILLKRRQSVIRQRAYLRLVLRFERAQRIMEDALRLDDLNSDPVLQAAHMRTAFTEALENFLIVIGIDPKDAQVTDLAQLEVMIAQSDLDEIDKENALILIDQLRANMEQYEAYRASRQNAMEAAEATIDAHKDMLSKFEDMMTYQDSVFARYKLLVDDARAIEQTGYEQWQNQVAKATPDRARELIAEILGLKQERLRALLNARASIDVQTRHIQPQIEQYETRIRSLQASLNEQAVQGAQRETMRQRLRNVYDELLKLKAQQAFNSWYADVLAASIRDLNTTVAQLTATQQELGVPPAVDFMQQIATGAARRQTELEEKEAQLFERVATLEYAQRTTAQDQQRVVEQYNYVGHMRELGNRATLSVVLRDIMLIHSPDGYFRFLTGRGFSQVYVESSVVENEEGRVDLIKLRQFGRFIQAARQNNIKIKLLITGEKQKEFRDLTTYLRFLQRGMIEEDVYVDGFALDLDPTGEDGTFNEYRYRDDRNDIGRIIEQENERLLDDIQDRIKNERRLGNIPQAERLQSVYDELVNTGFRYEYDVFESPQVAMSLDRSKRYRGTTVVMPAQGTMTADGNALSAAANIPHGVGFDWRPQFAAGREQELPGLLKQTIDRYMLPGMTAEDAVVVVQADSAFDFARRLAALGDTPVTALTMLATEEDLQATYNKQLQTYLTRMEKTIGQIGDILAAEKKFRERYDSLFGAIQTVLEQGIVFELPEFFLPQDAQYDSLVERYNQLKGSLNKRMDMEEADLLARQIDELFIDMSTNIRRLRLGLNFLYKADEWSVIGYEEGMDTVEENWEAFKSQPYKNAIQGKLFKDYFEGKTKVKVDLMGILKEHTEIEDFLAKLAPVTLKLELEIATEDGKKKQRQLLEEFPRLRAQMLEMRTAALSFGEYIDDVHALDIQLQRDRYDLDMLRRSTDIQNKPDAQATPVTVTVDGRQQVISGDVFTVLHQVDGLLNQSRDELEQAQLERETAALLSSLASRQRTEQASAPPAESFLSRQPETGRLTATQYAQQQADDYRSGMDDTERMLRYAYIDFERCLLDLEQANQNLAFARQQAQDASMLADQWQGHVQDAFIDLITALEGEKVSRDVLYESELGEIGFTLRLDKGRDNLRDAYFKFDTVLHRFIRMIQRQSSESKFNRYAEFDDNGGITPGWGLDAILGSGMPYVSITEHELLSIPLESLSYLQDPTVLVSLYGGLVEMEYKYFDPYTVKIKLKASTVKKNNVSKAQSNLLKVRSQYILRQVVSQTQRDDLEAALRQFEYALDQYERFSDSYEQQRIKVQQATDDLADVQADYSETVASLNQQMQTVGTLKNAFDHLQMKLGGVLQRLSLIERQNENSVTADELTAQVPVQGTDITVVEAVEQQQRQQAQMLAQAQQQPVQAPVQQPWWAKMRSDIIYYGLLLLAGLLGWQLMQRLFKRIAIPSPKQPAVIAQHSGQQATNQNATPPAAPAKELEPDADTEESLDSGAGIIDSVPDMPKTDIDAAVTDEGYTISLSKLGDPLLYASLNTLCDTTDGLFSPKRISRFTPFVPDGETDEQQTGLREKLSNPDNQAALKAGLAAVLRELESSKYAGQLRNFTLTILFEQNKRYRQGKTLQLKSFLKKPLYIDVDSLIYLGQLENTEFETKVMRAFIEHQLRNWGRCAVFLNNDQQYYSDMTVQSLLQDYSNTWLLDFIMELRMKSAPVNYYQNDIGVYDPIRIGQQVIQLQDIDQFWKDQKRPGKPGKPTKIQSGVTEKSVLPLYVHKDDSLFNEYNHVTRTMEIVKIIGTKMGLSSSEIALVSRAALVHALGRSAVNERDFLEARQILQTQAPGRSLSFKDVQQILAGHKKKRIDTIMSEGDDLVDMADSVQDIHARYAAMETACKRFMYQSQLTFRMLNNQVDINVDPKSALWQIIRGYYKPAPSANPRLNLLTEILIAADIVDSSQAKERSGFYGRKDPAVSGTNKSLTAMLRQAQQSQRISPQTHRELLKLLFIEQNPDLVRVLTLARQGVDASQPDEAFVRNQILQEINRLAPAKKIQTPQPDEQPSEPIREQSVPINDTQQRPQPVKPAPVSYTEETVNRLFESFVPSAPQEIIRYIEHLQAHPDAPQPGIESLIRNPFFRSIQLNRTQPGRVLDQLYGLTRRGAMDAAGMLRLLSVLESAGFVQQYDMHSDVIVLDADAVIATTAAPFANKQIRNELLRYLTVLHDKYASLGRTAHIVLFSQHLSTPALRSALGTELSSSVELYGNELLADTAATGTDKFESFLMTLVSNFNVNRVNLKVFSNQPEIVGAARTVQAILADQTGSVFDALRIFANIHPQQCADLLDVQSKQPLSQLLKENNGYHVLGGTEIGIEQKPGFKIRQPINRSILESAA